MRKIRGVYLILILAVVSIFAFSTIAWAGVSKVLCVPWQGNPNLPHTAINGESVGLYAVIYGDATGGSYSYTWDFMDGTPVETATITVPAGGIYNLSTTHAFSGNANETFNTKLTINGKMDTYPIVIGLANDTSRVNIAIDKGLWWLHTQMHRSNGGDPDVPTGYWDSPGYLVGATGASVWAFEVQGHLLSVEADPLNPIEDPYVEDVQRGINFLLTRMYNQPMNGQGWGNPDYDGNGQGLLCYWDGGHTNYEQGLAMGAIAGSGRPDATAATSPGGSYKGWVYNRTYKAIVQDMADWYAWSQIDDYNFPPTGPRGGFYYTQWDSGKGNWDAQYGDNSASQWAYIGMEAAQSIGCTIQPWVKAELAGYLHGQIAWNSRGFVSYRSNDGTPNVCLTGGALVGMAVVGKTAYDAQNGAGAYDADLALIQNFMGAYWQGQESRWTENWYGHRAYYTMYAAMKGFRLNGISSLPGSPGTTDWYKDYVSVMIPSQNEDGHFYGSGWMDGYIVDGMGTAFGVLILTPGVISLSPVACFQAKPNPGYKDLDVAFDPHCSYHMDPNKKIVKYEWDWNSDGTYDQTTATPDIVKHQWNANGVYDVTLRVTDDSGTPITSTTTVKINITVPPHPPVANPGGPYTVSLCTSDSLQLDGSASFDIDEGQSESGSPPFDTITAWDWDLNGAPWNYDNKSGKKVTVSGGELASFFTSAGTYQIGLRVTDNTALAYPGSGQPNLTDTAPATVVVRSGGSCNLAARPKSGKIQLTWTHTGAASYDIYRSTAGPNTGFAKIAGGVATNYATYLDGSVVNGTTYYYRVAGSDGKGTNAASAKPAGR